VQQNRLLALALLCNLSSVPQYHTVLATPGVLAVLLELMDQFVADPCKNHPLLDENGQALPKAGYPLAAGVQARLKEEVDPTTLEPTMYRLVAMTLCNLSQNQACHQQLLSAVCVFLGNRASSHGCGCLVYMGTVLIVFNVFGA